MTSRTRLGRFVPAILAVAAACLVAPDHAQAQFGFGGFGGGFGGFGYGGFGFRPVPTPESYLYSKSLVDASRPLQLPSRDVYANNPNSYINHMRDNGFVDRYSADRREMPKYRYPARQPRAAAAAQRPPRRRQRKARVCRFPASIMPRASSSGLLTPPPRVS